MNYLLLKTKSALQHLFPKNWAEGLVFFFFLCSYSLLSYYIAYRYRIIFDNRIPWDAYFSFDNRAIVLSGGGFERHPFANYWFSMIRKIALYFSGGTYNGTFRFVLAECSSITISFSILYVYKMLKDCIKISTVSAFLFCFFYGFFSTNIMLSFTPETYTYSATAISFFLYFSAYQLQNNKNITIIHYLVFTIIIGGLTITNASKVYLPLLFDKPFYRSWRNFGNTIIKVVVSTAAFALLYLYRLDFDYHRIISKTGEQYEKFTQAKPIPLYDMATSWFFGGNVLFSSFAMRDYHNKNNFFYKALFMELYSSYFPIILVLCMVTFLLWAWWRMRGQKVVHLLISSLLVDIIIHLGLGFGTQSSYIYGGHFVFIFIWLIAYLYQSFQGNWRYQYLFGCILITMGVFLVMNNLYRMSEFIDFCHRYYL